jgi:hypothetical protein
MTKIHNAFSSEEWKEDFKAKFWWKYSTPPNQPEETNKLSASECETLIAFFAAELEKKEKEVNEIIKSIVPEKKEIKKGMDIYEMSDIDNFNACIDELNKNIGE